MKKILDSSLVWRKSLPYFPARELACKGTGIVLLDIRFASKIVYARMDWGNPWDPSSVCRTPEHNRNINNGRGGHPSSLHLTENPKHDTNGTCAMDIKWRHMSSAKRLEFARFLYHKHGFSVGLHNGFVHIDLRSVAGLSQGCFDYGSWSGGFTIWEVQKP